MRPATPEELARWDELVLANPDGGAVMQLKALGDTKRQHGWRIRYEMMGDTAIFILVRQIPGLGELWYVPNGPGVASLEGLKTFAEAVTQMKPRPFMVKIDPEIPKNQITPTQLSKLGFVVAPRNIQYNVSTAIVDLSPDEDGILALFKQKTRYNVRLAAKKGVVVEAVATNDATIDTFYRLAEITYRRAGVYVRSRAYFADFWRLYAESGHGQMFFAKFQGEVLAAAFIIYTDKTALYKDGASSREHSSLQAPYLLQWEIMRWLKARCVQHYDLHGVPPADRIDDPTHPLAGLARFKTGFQPEVTEYIGTYDLPLNPTAYARWLRYAERIAVAYEYRVRKRLFY